MALELDIPALRSSVDEAFARRLAPVAHLADDADDVAAACRAMAGRFSGGGKLLVFGNGGAATDAEHVAVEFVHPVIVGKRALPALSLTGDVATLMGIASRRGVDEVFAHQLSVLGRGDDIALGISADGSCANVLRGLQQARAAGMLTVALVGGDGGAVATSGAADHCLVVRSDDPRVVKEGHVTTYHVLWELVHVFFDQSAALEPERQAPPPGGVEALYPFLYAGSTDAGAVMRSVADSTREKVAEIVALRRRVGEEQGARLAECAADMARAFAAGGTLLAFGNGGSSTDSDDVVHTFLDPTDGTGALPALCLTNDAAVVTALSNDVGFEVVFARQLRAFGRGVDVAFGVSTSGGSANVLAGFDEAARMGMLTVGLSGSGGGRMAELASLQHLFSVPSSSVHRVQEVQTTLYHVLWEVTSAALAGRTRPARSSAPATAS